jgi:hypothetical protein
MSKLTSWFLLLVPVACLAGIDIDQLARKCSQGSRRDCEKLASAYRQNCIAGDSDSCEKYLQASRPLRSGGSGSPMANDLLLKAARGGDVAGIVDAIDKGAVPDARSGSRSEIWALTGKPDYSPSGASGLQEENWTPLFHTPSRRGISPRSGV